MLCLSGEEISFLGEKSHFSGDYMVKIVEAKIYDDRKITAR